MVEYKSTDNSLASGDKKKARVTKLDETEWGQRIISQQRATKRVKNQGEAANE